MKMIPVPLKEHSYKITVGHNILNQLGRELKTLKIGKDAVVITNPIIRKYHGKTLISSLKRSGFSVKVLEVPAGERSKSAKCAFRLIEEVARYDALKKVFIVAFGGGVIGDLAGYVAAAYKRGIPYVQVPTTLLAQVDSAIGGKVAVDLPWGKNLIGAFYQPRFVLSDVSVLSTLTKRQIRNGLAEVVKYGVIKDAKFFDYLDRNCKNLLALNPKNLVRVVEVCSRLKRDVVLKDEKETKGVRTILNFGHTIGHAIEAAEGYNRYHHGEAVALGMRVAGHISYQRRMCRRQDIAVLDDLLSRVGLPERIKGLKMSNILRVMKHDKKFLAGKNRFVLMEKIGKVKVVEGLSSRVIQKAIKAYQ